MREDGEGARGPQRANGRGPKDPPGRPAERETRTKTPAGRLLRLRGAVRKQLKIFVTDWLVPATHVDRGHDEYLVSDADVDDEMDVDHLRARRSHRLFPTLLER